MKNKLNFLIKEVYGRPLFYPQNKQAELAAKLVGKKTLTPSQVQVLVEMGFDVVQVPFKADLNKIIDDAA